ncbi:prepilin peptidase [Tritonibacter sp. SIMBA_163]|uniref:prepilin peptidase n=1 Tax=Tritonibacter sp. SIMBA_163 TaxID=3080868 RepID=UPI00397F3670
MSGLVTLALCVCAIWVSYTDLSRKEVPDTAVYLIALTALVVLHLRPETVARHHFLAAAILFLCLWSAGELYYRWTGVDGLGMGDAKLLGAGTLLLGPLKVPDLLLLSCIGGIVACLVFGWRTGKMPEGIPFGPFISYAILICYFQEPLFLSAYS